MMILNMKTISNKSKSKAVPEGRKGCGAEAFISAGTQKNKRISLSSDMHIQTYRVRSKPSSRCFQGDAEHVCHVSI